MANLSTLKIFILVAIGSILLFVFLAGKNPFSFGEAYFMPRSNSTQVVPQPSYTVLPPDNTTTQPY